MAKYIVIYLFICQLTTNFVGLYFWKYEHDGIVTYNKNLLTDTSNCLNWHSYIDMLYECIYCDVWTVFRIQDIIMDKSLWGLVILQQVDIMKILEEESSYWSLKHSVYTLV